MPSRPASATSWTSSVVGGSSRCPKERAIRERFGFSAARYQQLLNRAIDRPEALAYDPMLVRRLRRGCVSSVGAGAWPHASVSGLGRTTGRMGR